MAKNDQELPPVLLILLMLPLSKQQVDRILYLLDHGVSASSIAKQTGSGKATISRIRQIHRPNLPVSSGGRPRSLTDQNVRHGVHLIASGKADTAVEVARKLRDITNKPLSDQTVRNYLKEAGLKAVVKKKKPLLSSKQIRDRLDFAISHKDWTIDDWKRVVWSDETKINRLQSDGRKWTWKEKGQGLIDREVKETLKFGGGSVMVWGCMHWEGKGNLVKIDGKMDADLYVSILDEDLMDSLNKYGKTAAVIIFQQDNDPKHTSKKAKKWFEDNGFTVLLWPANSPDLNPIEHLWNYIKERLKEYPEPPMGILELWDRIQDEWNKIPAKICQDLIESMPRRMAAVIEAKGKHTKY